MKVLFISANTEKFNMPAMPLGLACVAEALDTIQRLADEIRIGLNQSPVPGSAHILQIPLKFVQRF